MSKNGRSKDKQRKSVNTNALLNDVKRGIGDYFRKTLPVGLQDPHRFILVVKGHIWIPVAISFDRHLDGMELHIFRYAYYNGQLNEKTVTLCTNTRDSIHDLGYFRVGGDSGLVVADGTTLTSNGGLHCTGRKVKTVDKYASTLTEIIDDENEVSYRAYSRKNGVLERDKHEKFQVTDISSSHYKACTWLTSFYFRFLANAAQPAERDIVIKSLLFLLYQDKTLLYHNSVAPLLLQLLSELDIIDVASALEIVKKWACTRIYSDNALLAVPSSDDLRCRARVDSPQATVQMLIDRYDEIDKISGFLADCPVLAHVVKDKSTFYAMLGLNFKRKKKLSMAKTAYEFCLEHSDDDYYLGNYATILYRLGNYREAEELALKSLADEEDKAYANLRLGHIYLAMQDYSRAISCYSMGMAANKGCQLDPESGRYHIAYLVCAFWNAIIGCCIGEDPGFEYAAEDQFKAITKKETLYLASLYEYVKIFAQRGEEESRGSGEAGLLTSSKEFFASLKETLNDEHGDDKDIFVWAALLDNRRIRHEWLADMIAERVCGLINLMSVCNPEEDVRLQINNKFKKVVFKLFDHYLQKFGNSKKALALLEFYNGVVFRFNLEAIKSADLATAKRELERLSAEMYREAEDFPPREEELRKSFTAVDLEVACKFERAYQRFFGIIRDFNISLESFREYCETIDTMAKATADGSGVILAFVDEEGVCGAFALQGGALQFIPLDQVKYRDAIGDFDGEIARIGREYLFEDYENDLQALIGRLCELCVTDIFSRLALHRGGAMRVVPAGVFHLLPFHALMIEGERLVERLDLSYSNNVTLSKKAAVSQGDYLLVGNAEFADRPLQGAEAEIAAIREHLPGASVRILVRKDATKERFLESLRHGTNLHIACHAHFNDAHPMTSMFNLHPIGDRAGSNVSAGEIVGYNLKGCNFVYLSACDSGKGKVLTGNEVMGIPRGFFMAGASNVICTMWPLCDDYAPEIAANFYRHFLRSEAVSESFNRSMRDAISDQVPIFAWAPFKLLTVEQPTSASR